MKKIVEKVVITKENVLWKAYDGTTFVSEEECKKYEATAESVIKKAFMKLVVGNIVPECYIWGGLRIWLRRIYDGNYRH